jgi:hypothetical protein
MTPLNVVPRAWWYRTGTKSESSICILVHQTETLSKRCVLGGMRGREGEGRKDESGGERG